MTKYNPEFLKALAYGDEKAHEELKKLPLTERMGIGAAVDQLQREENIVPMNNGFSIYEQKKSKYVNDDDVAQAFKDRMDRQKAEEERQQKLREKYIEEQTREAVKRSRAGLPR